MQAILTGVLMASDHDEMVAYQVRCRRSWLDRVQKAAEAIGLSAAAYIRMTVTQRMDADQVPPSPKPKKRS